MVRLYSQGGMSNILAIYNRLNTIKPPLKYPWNGIGSSIEHTLNELVLHGDTIKKDTYVKHGGAPMTRTITVYT